MNREELFEYLHKNQTFPEVKRLVDIKYAKSDTAKINSIQVNGVGELSVGVTFEGMFYKKWFNDSQSDDKRRNYLYQLEIVQ